MRLMPYPSGYNCAHMPLLTMLEAMASTLVALRPCWRQWHQPLWPYDHAEAHAVTARPCCSRCHGPWYPYNHAVADAMPLLALLRLKHAHSDRAETHAMVPGTPTTMLRLMAWSLVALQPC